MKRLLSMILAVALLFGMIIPISVNAETVAVTKPNAEWAEENGWIKSNSRYAKKVDGVLYEVFYGRNVYDRLINGKPNYQIVTIPSTDTSGGVTVHGSIDGFSVKSVSANTFRSNMNITDCIISEGVEIIGDGAFQYCYNLEKVSLPNSLKMIDAGAFYLCESLEEMTIPASVEYIGRNAFGGTGFKEITFEGNAPEILYTSEQVGYSLEGLDNKIINVYEGTTGWDSEIWTNFQLNEISSNIETPEVKPTGVPEVTEAPIPTVTATVTPSPTETEMPSVQTNVLEVFSDVHKDWYTKYVQYVFDNDLMKGISGTTEFRPNSNITKAQVAQVLYNMVNQPYVNDFKVFTDLNDVYNGEWYANAVAWAYNTGIVTGDTNAKKFFPNANVTREQLALMIYRFVEYKGYDTSATSNFKGLVHAENVSSWAVDGMKWAVGTGLISGIEKNGVKDLAPQGTATRAQIAAILQRFCEAYGL